MIANLKVCKYCPHEGFYITMHDGCAHYTCEINTNWGNMKGEIELARDDQNLGVCYVCHLNPVPSNCAMVREHEANQ